MAETKYSYVLDGSSTVSDIGAARSEGLVKRGDSYIKRIEIGDNEVLVESHPVISTSISVYVTAHWTDGKTCTLRLEIPIEYVAGYEEDILGKIQSEVISLIENDTTGLERIDTANLKFDELTFPEPETEFEIEEAPLFKRRVVGDVIQETEVAPSGFDVLGRNISRGARSVLGGVSRAVGGVFSALGNGLSRIGNILKRF